MSVPNSIVNQNQLQIQITENQDIPGEGPRAIPVTLDFTVADTWVLDLSQLQKGARISMVQTLYVDLSSTTSNVTIKARGTNQLITAKGHTQGYYNVLAINPTVFEISCPGGPAGIPVHLINVPIAGAVWATQ